MYLSVGLCMFSWCFMRFCLLVRLIILLLLSVVVYAWQGLWVSRPITHSPTWWHLGEWQRVVVTGNARSVGPSTLLSHSWVLPAPPASRQCRLSAVSAGLTTLWQHFLHLLSACFCLHLCYVTYSTWRVAERGGGVVARILYVRFVFTVHREYFTRTRWSLNQHS